MGPSAVSSDIATLIHALTLLINRSAAEAFRIETHLLQSGRPSDLRCEAISAIVRDLMHADLGCQAVAESVLSAAWWESHARSYPLPLAEPTRTAEALLNALCRGVFLAACQHLEAYLRSIHAAMRRATDQHPESSSLLHLGTALLGHRVTGGFPQAQEFLALTVAVRDTLRNQGIYYDEHRPTLTIVRGGHNFIFKNNQPPTCLNPLALVERITEIVRFLAQVSADPSILALPRLEDPQGKIRVVETETIRSTSVARAPRPVAVPSGR
jgi:hypothetical protein